MWLIRVTIPVNEGEATVLYYWIETSSRDEAIGRAKESVSGPNFMVNAICCTETGPLSGHRACNDEANAIRRPEQINCRPVSQENVTIALRSHP